MILDASVLSRWEQCHRIPRLLRQIVPIQPPVRSEIAQLLQSAVRQDHTPAELRDAFIRHAAQPGFSYPKAVDYYVLAHDYATWIEGAAELIAEQRLELGPLQPLALCEVKPHQIHVDGWLDSQGIVHIWRLTDSFPTSDKPDAYTAHWPEMVAQAATKAPCCVHLFRLPSVRLSRLPSPLVMAYEHPMTGQIRLHRINAEGKGFNKSWKRKARWEYQDEMNWQEWRDGIERDQCLDTICRDYLLPAIDVEGRKEIKHDLRAICEVISGVTKLPRKRESCDRCEYSDWCHGSERDRKDFQTVEEMHSSEVRETQAPDAIPGG